ncbi:MAG: FAD-dependent oxidoreductase [Phycisphaeraceae bacterium]|nr:FAD-dependent oxidoreductase [Phycisphaeraceae bacterium]
MTAEKTINLDVVILGGGVAGLWTACRLHAAGYLIAVVEAAALGSRQTIASQGIIHGGVKYALTGAASRASQAIAAMPEIWRECLAGRGEVDLSETQVLRDHQHLWTTASIASKFAGLAASKVIRTEVSRVDPKDRPAALAAAPGSVSVYRVDEPVLDPRSLVRNLADRFGGALLLGDSAADGLFGESTDGSVRVNVRAAGDGQRRLVLAPRHIILAAGEANARLARELDAAGPATRHAEAPDLMQTRPLHMVMVRSATLPLVYGHCIALSEKPRLTITSQKDSSGRAVWYVGGQLAEGGVALDRGALIAEAKKEIAACIGWIDVSNAEWATLRIDRAEGLTENGDRPDEPVVTPVGEAATAVWPTKLAFAPLVARRVCDLLAERGITPRAGESRGKPGTHTELADWPRPAVAELAWNDERLEWSR